MAESQKPKGWLELIGKTISDFVNPGSFSGKLTQQREMQRNLREQRSKALSDRIIAKRNNISSRNRSVQKRLSDAWSARDELSRRRTLLQENGGSAEEIKQLEDQILELDSQIGQLQPQLQSSDNAGGNIDNRTPADSSIQNTTSNGGNQSDFISDDFGLDSGRRTLDSAIQNAEGMDSNLVEQDGVDELGERMLMSTSSITDIPPALNNPIGRKIIAIANKYAGGDVTVMYRIYELLKKPTPGNIFKAAKLLGNNADQILPAIAALLFTPAVGKIVKAAFFIYKKKRYIIYGLAVIVFIFFLITYVVQDLWNWVKDNKNETVEIIFDSSVDIATSLACQELADQVSIELTTDSSEEGPSLNQYKMMAMAPSVTGAINIYKDTAEANMRKPNLKAEIELELLRKCILDANLVNRIMCARRGLDSDCFEEE